MAYEHHVTNATTGETIIVPFTPEEIAAVEAAAAVPIPEVKLEANRRIEAVMPDYAQRNALAMGIEAIQTHGPDPDTWPEDLKAINTAIQSKWLAIKVIRLRSNMIEVMDPIPRDFREDKYWE